MLIVNADDWGHDEATTDAIRTVHAAGRISSATAMVHMADSRRAAGLAGEAAIPLGLHLNLMEPYTDPGVAAEVARPQRWAVGRYQASFASRWLPGPRLFATARDCVGEQLGEFRRLYGSGPTHVDGHQHGHLSTPALWGLARRGRPPVRSSFTFRPGEKPPYNRALRFGLNRAIGAAFPSTQRFYSIRDLHPRLGGSGLAAALAEADRRDVEIMVHPGIADEYEILMGSEWAGMIAGSRLGSFAELPGTRR
jgi:predicted glycoside hydrolase/deacetylase ChbG (UPF0249 family)